MDVNEVDYIKIGQRIRAARLKLGWQQAEVAFRAGLTTSHMSHIETGQTKVAHHACRNGVLRCRLVRHS